MIDANEVTFTTAANCAYNELEPGTSVKLSEFRDIVEGYLDKPVFMSILITYVRMKGWGSVQIYKPIGEE